MDPVASLSEEPISRLGSLPLLAVAPEQTVRDTLDLLRKHRRGCVLVCRDRRVEGVLTERDILRWVGSSRSFDLPVTSAVSGQVWSIRPEETMGAALKVMNRHKVRHLPVVLESGEPVGILSIKRIVRALVEHFPSSVYNLPPVADHLQKDREGA